LVHVSKIELRGFKSFGNKKVTLPLSPNLTAIVGPNGSGKSNVVEALSFVLGQLSAKSMRAERFSDLIFYGGNGRRPAPFAEVALHFDNSSGKLPVDAKNIKVSRQVSRNGKCTYRVNKKRVARQRIVDLLARHVTSPEGHNFVMQGDVDKFIKMSSLERRQIIDGLAGVAEFDEKKTRALSELEKVEGNLQSMGAALDEIGRQMQKLSAQRDDALRFKQLGGGLEETRAALLYLRRASYQKKLSKLRSKLESGSKRLEELRKKKEELEKEERRYEDEEKKLSKFIEEEESSRTVVAVERLRERVRTFKETFDSTERSYRDMEKKIKRLQSRIKEVAKDARERTDSEKITELSSEFSELRGQFNNLTKKLGEKRQPPSKIRPALSRLRKVLDRMHAVIAKLDDYLKETLQSQEELAQLAEKAGERQQASTRLQRLRAEHIALREQRSVLQERLHEFEQKIDDAKKSLEAASKDMKKVRGSIQDARKKREELQEKISKIGGEISRVEQKIEEIKDNQEGHRVKEAGLKAEFKSVKQEWVGLKEKPKGKPKTSASELERKLNRIKAELEKLEPVNMQALQDYRETKKRYDSQKGRYDKLVGEKQALLDFMREIDQKKTRVFMETFNQLSQNFTKIFRGLSPGGTAQLVLENPEAPLEGGLEIEANPAGKKLLRADSMSGGEKALTALAFIFALQRARPTTLYVLDEIDAHLDPGNLKRVAKMLRRSARQSQVIVITLRDAMMSVADRLFGVSMDKAGESHLVSVELAGLT
jgi:chromosome segregation ATPase